MLKKIWEGPFAIGPLHSSPTGSELVAKVLEVAWKAVILGVVGFGVLILGAVITLPFR